ncbi:UNVERIFIED_CONTAM: hypothetical protein Cloal_2213 [Acetivibrio alkalicellulosi]
MVKKKDVFLIISITYINHSDFIACLANLY